MDDLIIRFSQNPILQRDTLAGYDALFNPGAIRCGDKLIIVVRAARDSRFLAGATKRNYLYTNQICDHLIFELDENEQTLNFTGRKMTGSAANWLDGYTGKIAVPTYFGPYGTEDLRLCQVGQDLIGLVHVNTHEPYRGDHKAGGRIGLVLTRDFKHFNRWLIGPLREETDRDAGIIDLGDKIAFIHRIKPDAAGERKIEKPGIQVAFFKNLEELIKMPPSYWQDHLKNIHQHTILAPHKELPWEEDKIGAGPIIEHEAGYVMFYHGVGKDLTYSMGVALLDKTTLKAIARLAEPLLPPHTWYETGGRGEDVNNVIYPGGIIRSKKDPNRLTLYYGAADTHVAAADIPDLDKLVAAIVKSPIKGI
jgi:predicted GH43/DUF377 family glycosyl hydrolase